jgi:hypothetical protein
MRTRRRLRRKAEADRVVRVEPDDQDFQDDISRTCKVSILPPTFVTLSDKPSSVGCIFGVAIGVEF